MNILGRTGLKVSPIGFGGIVVMNATPEDAAEYVAYAVESGINYFDVAPGYGDAELKLGPALEPFRKDVHLACKTHHRDAKNARESLKQSLERLKTDYFDVYQLHGIKDIKEDVEPAFAKGGAMEVLIEAKEAGIVRNLGFSAHNAETALAAMQRYDFDTIMYPINFSLHFEKDFEVKVLKEARKRNMGIIAIKSLAKGKWQSPEAREKFPKCWYEPYDDGKIAELAINFTLSQAAIAISPSHFELLQLMVDNFSEQRELKSEELEFLKAEAKRNELIF